MRPALRIFGLSLMLLSPLFAACDKEKAKPDETKKSEPTPVPSDMVFNDFRPTTGSAAGLGVRDAGLEGGLAAISGSAPGAEPGGSGDAPAEKMRVTESGGEPRAVRRYAFAANRVEKRILTMQQSVSQTMQGQTQPGQEITLKMSLDLTPKQVKKEGSTIEVKLTKVELPGAPPQATQMLASLGGLAGTFDVTPHGEAGEISFTANQQMKSQLAETVVQGLSQAVQLLLAPFPEAPIGVGAKWEIAPSATGQGDQGMKRFTLKELSAEGGVVGAEIDIKVPRRAQQGPRGGTMFVEVEGKGRYTYQVRFDRVSPRVEGELVLAEKIEVPDPKGGGGKQAVLQTQKAKHLLESAPASR